MTFAKDDLVTEIIERVDIVEVISEHVVLGKRGKDYWGRCPFHAENTPSFSVSAEKKLFYCFGCQAGGNVITFLKLKENLSFGEAVNRLAERAGIERRSQEHPARQRQRSERERFFKLNELAARFFAQNLINDPDAEKARRYLEQRGVNETSIKGFNLGYAPRSWDKTLNYLVRQGYMPPELERYGLVSSRSGGGGYYDRFRGRLMFPIKNYSDQVVGFGARSLDGEDPKYLNSPESKFFEKGSHLYGLGAARRSIGTADQVVVVEGYLDALSAHQFGVTNVVATMGTALTNAQLQLLLRYAAEVVLAFDNDEAGRNAAVRSASLIRGSGGRVKIASLAGCKDPDEYLQKNGGEAFQRVLAGASDYLIFRLQTLLARGEHQSSSGKLQVIDEFWNDYQSSESELERQSAIQYLSQALQVPELTIRKEFQQRQRRRKIDAKLDNNTNIVHTKNGKLVAWELAERQLLRMMLRDKKVYRQVLDEYGIEVFISPGMRAILEAYAEVISDGDDGKAVDPAWLAETIEDDVVRQTYLKLHMEGETIPLEKEAQRQKALADFLRTLVAEKHRSRIEQIDHELIEAIRAGEQEKSRELMSEKKALEAERKSWGRGEKRL
ncbi:MAG: DNA primase [Firmicutes bacterium]|nr:DNA primase [Bacillota bacterium]